MRASALLLALALSLSVAAADESFLVGPGTARTADSASAVLSNGGASLSVSVPGQFGGAVRDGQEVRYSGDERYVRMRPSGPDAFEVDIVLLSEPSAYVFPFSLSDSGLDYYYQPPLNEEYDPRTSSCNATACVDGRGEAVTVRPDNVVGSYAVYSGQRKVFHVFRPRITDSSGSSVWGTLTYDGGVMYVGVPDGFLSSASYPVVVDPVFGYTEVGGSVDMTGAYTLSQNFSAPVSGNASPGTAYLYARLSSGGPSNVGVRVYAKSGNDSVNQPAVSSSTNISLSTVAGWRASNISWQGIVGGSQYWVMVQGIANTQTYYDSTAGTQLFRSGAYNGAKIPDTWFPNPPGGTLFRSTSLYIEFSGDGQAAANESSAPQAVLAIGVCPEITTPNVLYLFLVFGVAIVMIGVNHAYLGTVPFIDFLVGFFLIFYAYTLMACDTLLGVAMVMLGIGVVLSGISSVMRM